DPIAAAMEASGTWLSAVTRAGEAGYRAGLSKVDKQAMADTIAASSGTYTSAGAAKAGKYDKAMSTWLPIIYSTAASLPARGDVEANIARSAAQQRALHAAKLQRQGS